ncbi:MAG: AraC family transcriptional regulator [Calditrichaeota bacterium]|nr:AraC family transcriptional regulator [Calditrichota bacterium]
MIYKRINPADTLANYVECYWIIENESIEIVEQKIIPDGFPEIIFHYSDPYEINISGDWEIQSRQLLAGQIRNHFFLRNTGKSSMFGIKLKPAAVSYFFGLDLDQLTDQVVDLAKISGDQWSELNEHVQSIPDHNSLIDFCNQFLNRFIEAKRISVDNKLEKAIGRIFQSHGSATVAELCEASGLSERSLERQFKKRIGLGPKYYARIIRFNRVFELTADKQRSWSDITHEIGYYDQAHFIKDFKTFSGEEPSRYLFDLPNMANFFLREK